jgi:hypothetical protein
MKQRTPKDWQRLVAAYESGTENRREFCERRALSTSTLDYWRRRSRADVGGRLVEVEIEADAGTTGALTDSLVISHYLVRVRRNRIGFYGRARSGGGRLWSEVPLTVIHTAKLTGWRGV